MNLIISTVWYLHRVCSRYGVPRHRNALVASPAAAPRGPRCPPDAGPGTRRVLEAEQGACVIGLDQYKDAWLGLGSGQLCTTAGATGPADRRGSPSLPSGTDCGHEQ